MLILNHFFVFEKALRVVSDIKEVGHPHAIRKCMLYISDTLVCVVPTKFL